MGFSGHRLLDLGDIILCLDPGLKLSGRNQLGKLAEDLHLLLLAGNLKPFRKPEALDSENL